MTRAVASFTGAELVMSCEFTVSQGVLPSIAVLNVLPQGTITSDYGTLTLEEDGTVMQFPFCHVRFGSIRLNRQGQIVRMEVEDRRWAWKHRHISGLYNVTMPDGSTDPATLRTPQELVTMLFEALGEVVTPGMVAELPNDRVIEVDWVAAKARWELQRITGMLGCRICPGFDNLYYVRRLGTGSTLPTTNAKSISVGVSSAAPPETLGALGGETLVQSKLRLAPVGLNRDFSVVPIDELDYTPSGGWDGEYENIFQNISDPADRALAQLSVFKWYQADAQADGSLDVPGYNGEVQDISQILPLSRELLSTFTSSNGIIYPNRAYIEGTFKIGGDPDPRTNSESFTLLEEPFELVEEIALVKFQHPVVKQSGSGSDSESIEAADLYLTCSYSVKNIDSGQTERYYRERTIGPAGFGNEVLRDNAVVNTYIAAYDGSSVTSITDNTNACDTEADFLLDAAQVEYANYQVGDVFYVGLVPLPLSGTIRQWSAYIDTKRGCNTRISFNGSHDPQVYSHEEIKRMFDLSEASYETTRYIRRRKRGHRP